MLVTILVKRVPKLLIIFKVSPIKSEIKLPTLNTLEINSFPMKIIVGKFSTNHPAVKNPRNPNNL